MHKLELKPFCSLASIGIVNYKTKWNFIALIYTFSRKKSKQLNILWVWKSDFITFCSIEKYLIKS